MDKVQKIREEIEKLHGNPYYMMAVKDALAIIDSLQEEPVSEELIDVAKQYVKEHVIGIDKFTFSIATDMFISGAEWGKKQAEIQIKAQSMALTHGCPKESVSSAKNTEKKNWKN